MLTLCSDLMPLGMTAVTENKLKKKITYIITRGVIGGAQFHTLDLIKEFSKDYEILLISGSDGVLVSEAKKNNVRVKVVPEIDSLNFLFAITKLYKILKSEGASLIHVHSSLASIYGRIAAKLSKIEVVYTVHGWHFAHEPSKVKKSVKINVERLLKSFTSYWITVSEFDGRLGDQHNLFASGRVRTIPNGVQQSQNKFVPAGLRKLSAVFVGRATYQKNCDSAINVLEHSKSGVGLTMFASGGNISSLEYLVEKSSAAKKIKLVVNEPNASGKVHKYSVMLVTSRYEGMPLSVLEAIREGLVIISTDVCGMDEVVVDGVNGYLLPENNEKEMARLLDGLIANPEKLNEMSEQSRVLFNEKFTLTRMLDANREIYKKIIL